MWIAIIILTIILSIIIRELNKTYFILAGCKRLRTVDGSPLENKVVNIPGVSVFGSNLDVINATPESAFQYVRKCTKYAKGKSFLLHFLWAPVFNVTNAEDAEEVLQSQSIITKSVVYDIIAPFLGLGLLISTDNVWQFRRKILTPAFHFNILQTFIDVFKEESHKFIEVLNQKLNDTIVVNELIPKFTLNNVCETALGVKLDNLPYSDTYRNTVHHMEPILVKRVCNPILYFDIVFRFSKDYKEQTRLIKIAHDFSSKIIETKREEFHKNTDKRREEIESNDIYGKKKRYAMLDTLLDAESQGLIDHQGICDEVNTFMFEGYDTTSMCLIFSLFNLAIHPDIQEKCYQEIKHFASIDEMSLFDFNKLEYLECIIKETLRLYPSVPFIARRTVEQTVLNGMIIPENTQINVHIFDIMRDPRHFPEPEKFDPDRFFPENTTHRHPFAFIPFSAGPRNCIGQKFAMLEIKVLLVAILQNFKLLPVTRREDVVFENGLVLRSKHKIKIRIAPRIN